jgi:hypothetical protein
MYGAEVQVMASVDLRTSAWIVSILLPGARKSPLPKPMLGPAEVESVIGCHVSSGSAARALDVTRAIALTSAALARAERTRGFVMGGSYDTSASRCIQ